MGTTKFRSPWIISVLVLGIFIIAGILTQCGMDPTFGPYEGRVRDRPIENKPTASDSQITSVIGADANYNGYLGYSGYSGYGDAPVYGGYAGNGSIRYAPSSDATQPIPVVPPKE